MVIKTVYSFVDSNLGVETSSKKKGGWIFEAILPGRGANDLPWRGKGLVGGQGLRRNYKD